MSKNFPRPPAAILIGYAAARHHHDPAAALKIAASYMLSPVQTYNFATRTLTLAKRVADYAGATILLLPRAEDGTRCTLDELPPTVRAHVTIANHIINQEWGKATDVTRAALDDLENGDERDLVFFMMGLVDLAASVLHQMMEMDPEAEDDNMPLLAEGDFDALLGGTDG